MTTLAVPGDLQWLHTPTEWNVEDTNSLTITVGAGTDWFIDPAGSYTKDNAPCALFTPPDQNFLLSAKVTVKFAAVFDAGAFHLRVQDDLWAKFAFEYSPQYQPMIVSVVTRGVSDDCNAAVIDGNSVYLRVARNGQTFAFHYSQDGQYWHLVRYFSLGALERLQVGFSAQSPTGEHCTAKFSSISYRQGVLKDNRSGE